MGDIVIVAYRPKPGCETALMAQVRTHLPTLRRLGFATDRPETLMRARDGVIIEVFEWKPGAIDKAHNHPDIQRMWRRYAELCDYVPLRTLPESADLFATFVPFPDP